MVLAVLYDLNDRARDYSKLYEKIKSYGGWMHYIDSAWLISPNKQTTPTEISNELKSLINERNDYLLVIEVKKNYQGWLPQEAWDWMKSRTFGI